MLGVPTELNEVGLEMLSRRPGTDGQVLMLLVVL